MSEPFIAEVRMWGLNFAPRGWAHCDGQLYPISQNTALFSLLGTNYGGDGRTTMGVPNLMDRAPMHPGRGPGLTPRRLGERTGTETVTLTQNQMPAHTHAMMGSTGETGGSGSADPAGAVGGKVGNGNEIYHTGAGNTDFPASTVSETGGGTDHNNSQPNLTLNFCIALVGLYPSRS